MPIKMDFKQVGLLCALTITLSACSTVKQKEKPEVKAPTVLIHKADLEQLQNTAEQWKTAQPNIEKLLQLEAKVSELTSNLEQIDTRNIRYENAIETIFNEESILKSQQILFAIQVASFKNKTSLESALAALRLKAPKIINAELPVNIEPIVVNNITLYRLKLGAYIKKAAAKNDCSILKEQKINCFVSYYTEQQPQ
ncbi:SPOR domain-containing protein [Pseudoalteromonas sp. Z9A5]|uniref:SPOR domain-containing protein n=1 Tax=Pseudoalteromonas sp. Z9A5 TaxID=2686355 RepID=UPI0014089821|nr:SPOR domain-containing protein [Pseudoalteromonas sp. Z9A5]